MVQRYYISQSEGEPLSPGTVALRGYSGEHFISNLSFAANAMASKHETIIDSSEDFSAFRLAALDFENSSTLPFGTDFVGHTISLQAEPVKPRGDVLAPLEKAFLARGHFFSDRVIQAGGTVSDSYSIDSRIARSFASPRTQLLSTELPYEVLNNFWFDPSHHSAVVIQRLGLVRDRLLFMPSSLGSLRDLGPAATQTLFFPERDPTFVGGWIQGINRFMLVANQNEAKRSRIVFSFSRTMYDRGASPLPDVTVLGKRRVDFGFVGSGSGRLFSPIVDPIKADNLDLLLLDLGVDGKPRNRAKPGIFSLINGDLPEDRRFLAAYARDLSTVPDTVYQHLSRPPYLSLPRDLRLSTLEYSGIYEDGWASADALIVLGSTAENGSTFEIHGVLPKVAATDIGSFEMDVSIGSIRKSYELPVGEFFEAIKLPISTRPTRILLHFKHPVLLDGDGRRVGALLTSVGFENMPNDLLGDVSEGAPNVVRLGSGWYDHETSNGESYRWAASDAEVIVDTKRTGMHHFRISIASGPAAVSPDNFELELLDSSGKRVASRYVQQRDVVDFPIRLPGHRVVLRLHVSSTNKSVGGDPRILTFRAFGVSVK